jgi:hypothetical protein
MKAMASRSVGVRMAAVRCDKATERVLMRAMGDRSAGVRWLAARNPAATDRVLMWAVADEEVEVRQLAAGSPQLPLAGAEQLLESEDASVLTLLGENESLPERIRVVAQFKAGVRRAAAGLAY